jgi:CHAT domain-containing protein
MSLDSHAPYVQQLKDAGDWAGLARYWIGHQHKPALAAALDCAQARAARDPRWQKLIKYLEKVQDDPLNASLKPSKTLLPLASNVEQATFRILQLYPQVALCETAGQCPPEAQSELFQLGLESAQRATKLGLGCQDVALGAYFTVVLVRGLQELQQLEQSAQFAGLALDFYRELARHRPEVYRPNVAGTLIILGNVRCALNDLEVSRASYEEGLDIYVELARNQPQKYRPDVAMTLNNLGNVQRDLNDLEAARANCEEALGIYRELAQDQPQKYRRCVAGTLNNLGTVQRALNDLDAARDSYEEALAIRLELARHQPEVYRPEVAGSLNTRGIVQIALNDLHAARASFEEAVGIYRELARHRPEVYRPDMAMALNNLGNVQLDLNDLEAARDSIEEALDIYLELARKELRLMMIYRADVASTLNNLGNVQSALNDLEAARDSYETGLGVYRELAQHRAEVHRPEVAGMLNNLGSVQRDLNNLDAARASYGEALDIYRELAQHRPDVYLPNVARALNNVGTVQRDDDLDAALDSVESGLEIYRELVRHRPEVYRPNIATSLHTLGNVQSALNNLEAARVSYEEALAYYEQEAHKWSSAHLVHRRECYDNLGRVLLSERSDLGWPDYSQARDYLRKARECAELFRGRFRDPVQRRRVLAESIGVYERLGRSCIGLWETTGDHEALREAVEVAESSRARYLLDLLADELLIPANTPAHLIEEFGTLRRRLEQARRQLEMEVGGRDNPDAGTACGDGTRSIRLNVNPGGGGESRPKPAGAINRVAMLGQSVKDAEAQYAQKLEEVHRYDPLFNPDQPVVPISCSKAQELIPDDGTALIQVNFTQEGGWVLILTRIGVQLVRLKGVQGELGKREVFDFARQWLLAYYQLRGENSDWLEAWGKAMPGLLETWSEHLVAPILKVLPPGIHRLIFSPNQAAHLIPFQACRMADGRLLTDQYEVIYAPSFSLLHRCARMARPESAEGVLVQNPTSNLTFAQAEGAAYRNRHPTTLSLERDQAVREDILRACPNSHTFHYTGHALFNPMDPLGSGLVLRSESDPSQWLTLRHVFAEMNLRRNRLTVLNGCESGMLTPDGTDDYLGLPSGFLYAGAACVISTLWAVNDLSSALVMDRFHGEVAKGSYPAAALREACRWLREDIHTGHQLRDSIVPEFLQRVDDDQLKRDCLAKAAEYAQRYSNTAPFASLAHWAPYICSGLGYRLDEIGHVCAWHETRQ